MNQPRHPGGTERGGEFAARHNAETSGRLVAPGASPIDRLVEGSWWNECPTDDPATSCALDYFQMVRVTHSPDGATVEVSGDDGWTRHFPPDAPVDEIVACAEQATAQAEYELRREEYEAREAEAEIGRDSGSYSW